MRQIASILAEKFILLKHFYFKFYFQSFAVTIAKMFSVEIFLKVFLSNE